MIASAAGRLAGSAYIAKLWMAMLAVAARTSLKAARFLAGVAENLATTNFNFGDLQAGPGGARRSPAEAARRILMPPEIRRPPLKSPTPPVIVDAAGGLRQAWRRSPPNQAVTAKSGGHRSRSPEIVNRRRQTPPSFLTSRWRGSPRIAAEAAKSGGHRLSPPNQAATA